jgi:hypothetical protein
MIRYEVLLSFRINFMHSYCVNLKYIYVDQPVRLIFVERLTYRCVHMRLFNLFERCKIWTDA